MKGVENMSITQLKIKLDTMAATFIDMESGDYLDTKIEGELFIDDDKYKFAFIKGNLSIYIKDCVRHNLPKETVIQIESHLRCYIAGIRANKTITCNVSKIVRGSTPELEE